MNSENDGGFECVYPLPMVATVTSIPLTTLRHWYTQGLLGENPGTAIADQPGINLSPAEILAAACARVLRKHHDTSFPRIKTGTQFLADLTLKDLELCEQHDQILVWADEIEPQLVGRDHEIWDTAIGAPGLQTIKIRQLMPTLRAAIQLLDALTNEKDAE